MTRDELSKQAAIASAASPVGEPTEPISEQLEKKYEAAEAKRLKEEQAEQVRLERSRMRADKLHAQQQDKQVRAEIRQSDKLYREQQGAEEKRSKGVEALQKQQARSAQLAQQKALKAAQHSGLPGPLGLVADAAAGPYEVAKESASDVAATLEKASTPGSILLPVLIVIILFLLVIPVNGYPRLAWLWFVITGNASLTGTGGGASIQSSVAPLMTPQTEEQAGWSASRALVEHYGYTGITDEEL
jgi:hypothetical protein